jgi:hypothetical protein
MRRAGWHSGEGEQKSAEFWLKENIDPLFGIQYTKIA